MRKRYKSVSSSLLKKLKQETVSYDRYASGELKFIIEGFDTAVNVAYSYSQWIEAVTEIPAVKVEGLKLIPKIKEVQNLKVKNIHLFVSVKKGFSFNWHKDDVNVFLYVVRGKKIVFIENKKYVLVKNQGVFIPKGKLHRVNSQSNTWALSIGY
jgi:mannose-6-phosphate isomerase-like protein (cupin superfamily)